MSPSPSNGKARSSSTSTTTASTTTAVDHASVKFSLQSSGSHATSQLAAAGSSLPPRGSNGHGGSHNGHGGGPSGPNGSNGHGSANGGGGPSGPSGPGGPKVGAFVPVPKQPIRRLTDSRCDPEELTGRTNHKYLTNIRLDKYRSDKCRSDLRRSDIRQSDKTLVAKCFSLKDFFFTLLNSYFLFGLDFSSFLNLQRKSPY
jgi:hypothetical protein